MYKSKVTKLKYLKEGDKFKFFGGGTWMPVWMRTSKSSYYVEGQYPFQGITTVIMQDDIERCSCGLCAKKIIAFNNDNPVLLLKRNAISVCHEVTFNK